MVRLQNKIQFLDLLFNGILDFQRSFEHETSSKCFEFHALLEIQDANEYVIGLKIKSYYVNLPFWWRLVQKSCVI